MTTLHRPVRVSVDDGVATVRFAFPGDPPNALSLSRLAAVVAACSAAADRPDVDLVVVAADGAAPFCPGLAADAAAHLLDPAERQAFSVGGQHLLTRLSDLPAVTVAVVAGACRGPGLELALACDYRLAVAGPDSWVGFDPGVRAAWGGSARLRRPLPGVVTAREAVKLGVFHDAFCQRRGRVEVRLWLDRLQRRPVKPRRRGGWFGPTLAERLARERAAFARETPAPAPAVRAGRPVPDVVGVWGLSPASAAVAVEAAVRGRWAVVAPLGGGEGLLARAVAAGEARGRWTPLEAAQALARVRVTADPRAVAAAGWVVPGDAAAARTLPVTRPPAAGTILGWYHALGLTPHTPPGPDAPPRRRLAAA